MSIITTFPAVPSRLFSIYAVLADSEDGELRQQVEAWATPPSLASRGGGDDEEASSALFTSALQEARKLRIVEEIGDRLRVPAEARGVGKNRAEWEVEFRRYVSGVLFDRTRAAEAEQNTFMLAIAWLLSKDPLQPLKFSEAPQGMLKADLGEAEWEKTQLTNRSSYQNFLYWARYLGFATFVGDGSVRRVFPDPTIAIAENLPRIFGDQPLLDIESFLSELSNIFPVFERGAVRAELDAMRPQSSSDEDRLSIATSLALQRLADRGELSLESVADARGRILDFGIETARVSRIRRGKTNDA
jgi:hypothetical protein